VGLIGRPSPDLRARELSHIDCGSTIIAPRHLVAHVSGEPVLILLHQSGRKSDWAWLSNQNAPPKMLCGNFSNITLDSSQMGNYALFNDVFRSGRQKTTIAFDDQWLHEEILAGQQFPRSLQAIETIQPTTDAVGAPEVQTRKAIASGAESV